MKRKLPGLKTYGNLQEKNKSGTWSVHLINNHKYDTYFMHFCSECQVCKIHKFSPTGYSSHTSVGPKIHPTNAFRIHNLAVSESELIKFNKDSDAFHKKGKLGHVLALLTAEYLWKIHCRAQLTMVASTNSACRQNRNCNG